MSGDGRARPVEPVDASDLRVAVVAASWHTQVMDGLLAGAAARAAATTRSRRRPWSGCPAPSSCRSSPPRSRRQGYDAVVALGVVIRGGTPHFEYVCSAATDGLTRVALDHRRRRSASACSPATPSSRRSTAPGSRGRSEDKGYEATAAALRDRAGRSARGSSGQLQPLRRASRRVHHPVEPLAVRGAASPAWCAARGACRAAPSAATTARCRRSTARSPGVRRSPRSRSAAPRGPPRWRSPSRRGAGSRR